MDGLGGGGIGYSDTNGPGAIYFQHEQFMGGVSSMTDLQNRNLKLQLQVTLPPEGASRTTLIV